MNLNDYSERLVIAANQNRSELDYWLTKLAGPPKKVSFPPTATSRPASGAGGIDPLADKSMASHDFDIDGDVFVHLTKICGDSDSRLHMMLVALVVLLLYKYSGSEDVVVSSPIYKQKTAGQYINTVLPLRIRLFPDMTLKDLLGHVRETVKEAVEHQNYPLSILLGQLNLQSTDGSYPLFDVSILLANIHDKNDIAAFPHNIMFHFERCQHDLSGTIEYHSSLYDGADMSRLADHFCHLVSVSTGSGSVQLSDIEIFPAAEKRRLLNLCNRSQTDFPNRMVLSELLAVGFARSPQAVAIRFADQFITYGFLSTCSRHLAHRLRELGVGPGVVTAVLLERSPDMIIGILSIIMAGGAYLPIDPRFPPLRILTILKDSAVFLLITRGECVRQFDFTRLLDLQVSTRNTVITPVRPSIGDFNTLPIPDRSLVSFKKYHQHIGNAPVRHTVALQSTRGCPYGCVFCHKIWPKRHTARDADHIFEEIRTSYEAGVRRFVFLDDIFNLDRRNSVRLLEKIIKARFGLQLFFPNGLRGDILSPDYIDLLAEAGTVNLDVALESASPRLQRLMGKNLELDCFCENVRYIIEKYPGIILEMELLVGFPTETEEEALSTFELLRTFRWVHFPNLNIVKIYPHTDLSRLASAHGVSEEVINRSATLAYHEVPDTLPFPKDFVRKLQARFVSEYIFSRERLLKVLPAQMKLLTEEELVKKYDSYLPADIRCFDDLLEVTGLENSDLLRIGFVPEEEAAAPEYDEKIRRFFPAHPAAAGALRILLLDLSQLYSTEAAGMLYDVVEPPLGLMYLLTYLNRELGEQVCGKILKSRIDFDHNDDLAVEIDEFRPHIIGIRTLTFYKDFCHRVLAFLKSRWPSTPVIVGGPYATSDYHTTLADPNVDLVAVGEGEETFKELIQEMLTNDFRLPGPERLHQIKGIGFIPHRQSGGLSSHGRRVLLMEHLSSPEDESAVPPLSVMNQPTDPAYVLYTSGSTGTPKGVVMGQLPLANLISWQARPRLSNIPDDAVRTLQFAPYVFDVSFQEIFSTFYSGGELLLISETVRRDAVKLVQLLREKQVRRLFLPYVFLNQLAVTAAELQEIPVSLRDIVTAGEQLRITPPISDLVRQVPGCTLHNHYGPTESHVVTFFTLEGETGGWPLLPPIGQPIANTYIYLLDGCLKPVPDGVPGEIFIGGGALAQGYLNRPEQTYYKFIPDPYRPGCRLYRTGDLGRRLPGGNIQFLGRSDNQVKVRGIRVEPEEIESHLIKHPHVKEAVVLWRELDNAGSADGYLAAYLVSIEEMSVTELRTYLGRQLPDHMIPNFFVPMDKLPLTVTGKIDYMALPDIADGQLSTREDYTPPGTPLEKELAKIWEDVLGRPSIGIHENFFIAGGDSIKSIQIVSRLKKTGFQVEANDIFQNPTIAELAPCLKRSIKQVDQSAVSGLIPLTPIQMDFFREDPVDPHHFNQSVMLFSTDTLSAAMVKTVFCRIQEHHDALRMTYRKEHGRVIQVNNGIRHPLSLVEFDLRGRRDDTAEMERQAAILQGGIDLEEGPLMKLGLFHLNSGDRLFIVIHHLVMDGVSWRILFEDIESLYRQWLNSTPLTLPMKTDSFKTWSEGLMAYSELEDILREIPFWRDQERRIEGVDIRYSRDFEWGNNREEDARMGSFSMGASESRVLLSRPHDIFGTDVTDILLTGLGLALVEVFGVCLQVFALERHGREELPEGLDISRTVGWFTSMHPVLLNFSHRCDLSRQILEVKETIRRVPRRGIGYGILRYLTPVAMRGNLEFNYEAQVSFNYLGQFDADIERMSSFGIAGESGGPVRSPEAERRHEFDVSGMVAAERLTISIFYNHRHYKSETIDRLLKLYEDKLMEIVNHCETRTEKEISPSDLGYKDLSVEDLKSFFN